MTTAGGKADVGVTMVVNRAPVNDKDGFLAMLAYGKYGPSDAVVVLAGEDYEARVAATLQLLGALNGDVMVCATGGVSSGYQGDAVAIQKRLMGQGWPRDRVFLDEAATNTWEQARNVVQMAQDYGWHRLHMVASSYHLPRAMLTFVQALNDAGVEDVCVTPVAAIGPWSDKPKGMDRTRFELFGDELAKIDEYREKGHVAPWGAGLAYLQRWELV